MRCADARVAGVQAILVTGVAENPNIQGRFY